VPERTTRFRVGANNKSGFRNRSMNFVTGNSNYLAIAGFMQLRSKKTDSCNQLTNVMKRKGEAKWKRNLQSGFLF
jgi:hypothetical protein